jgi:hypothetical protein
LKKYIALFNQLVKFTGNLKMLKLLLRNFIITCHVILTPYMDKVSIHACNYRRSPGIFFFKWKNSPYPASTVMGPCMVGPYTILVGDNGPAEQYLPNIIMQGISLIIWMPRFIHRTKFIKKPKDWRRKCVLYFFYRDLLP